MASLEVIEGGNGPLVLAYIHAWLQSAVGRSSIPYWVCHQIPQIRPYLRKLRAEPCQSPECSYCRETHAPTAALKRYFGFPSFRPVPAVRDRPEMSLQEAIVSTSMRGESALGILPTGGGKSLCFQTPALHRYDATGALSIVISPLQSLMRDQVENLKDKGGIQHTAALYGLLTPVERKYCLRDIRMGHVGLLYVSPEQLRSTAFKQAIECREIAYWIFDEAHCLSKWGHDFRVDYLYASKFIKKLSEEQNIEPPPVICVTATAKEDVKGELIEHFRRNLRQELQLLDGGTERTNLNYRVETVERSNKPQRIRDLLEEFYGTIPDEEDVAIYRSFVDSCIQKGAIVIFAATRKRVMEIYEWLAKLNWPVLPFHGGLKNEKTLGDSGEEAGLTKKDVLEQFLTAKSAPIIVATNAFGMGVDKPDIRKVIHADATGSLENYLQEAGRAGRDGEAAECILLYEPQDLETQFSMNHMSQLDLRDMQKIWGAVYSAKPDQTGTITVSSDEIKERIGSSFNLLGDGEELDDTKIKTAINILEDQRFLERTENRARVFEARLLVSSLDEARAKIARARVPVDVQKLWISVVRCFLDEQDDENVQVSHLAALDEMGLMFERLNAHGERVSSLTTLVFRTLNSMAKPEVGLLKKDLLYSALVKPQKVTRLMDGLEVHEQAILKEVEESFPDQDGKLRVSIRRQNEILLRHDVPSDPKKVKRVFYFLSRDDEWLSGDRTQMNCTESNGYLNVYFQKGFDVIRKQSLQRLEIAREVLKFIISKEAVAFEDAEGLYQFSEEELLGTLKEQIGKEQKRLNLEEVLQYVLLWLHENEVISLQQGRALITSAMTINLVNDGKRNGRKRRFNKEHFEAQALHYKDRQLQVHIVGEYANQAIRRGEQAHLQFIRDYFEMERTAFVRKYFTTKEQRTVLQLATGIDSYNKIVESLDKNQVQKEIVMSDGPQNDMVLAGPGSGKTMVIAHRCAWLLRVRRVHRASIIVLCFNRHAAVELRRRIWRLVGRDAAGVIIQTFHGLALRLLGRTMAQVGVEEDSPGLKFEEIIPEAIRMLKGEADATDIDAELSRQRILGSLSHILVDEYQDIDPSAYEFVSLMAGKSAQESENRLKILAVGDDDQSIYQFNGANVEYIRRYREDYAYDTHSKFPKPVAVHHMVENYRSTKNIIAAGNAIIANSQDRMKTKHPIKIDALRSNESAGGILEEIDPLTKGKIHIQTTQNRLEQTYACVDEIRRYLGLSERHRPEQCCIVARTNMELVPIRIALDRAKIPCSVVGNQAVPNLTRVKEVHQWLDYLKMNSGKLLSGEAAFKKLRKQLGADFLERPFGRILEQVGAEFYGETGQNEVLCEDILDFFYDALFEYKRRGIVGSGVILTTAHKVKGLEFDNVIILEGQWSEGCRTIDQLEEARRLYYVAVTRAKKSLTLFSLQSSHNRFIGEIPDALIQRSEARVTIEDPTLLENHYDIINLDDLYISYAAFFGTASPQTHALQKAKIGDLVRFSSEASEDGSTTHVFLTNEKGVKLARLSRQGAEKWRPRLGQIKEARVSCMHIRLRQDNQGENSRAKASWLIPVAEVLWRADGSPVCRAI
ncbi:MAG: RecQ family ATP-dependent DNA helicase [Opitutales bacterium]